jgi:hypothetical protein
LTGSLDALQADDQRVWIRLSGDNESKARAILEAIVRHNDPPHTYRLDRQLVRLVPSEQGLRIDPLQRESLRAHLGSRYQGRRPFLRKDPGTGVEVWDHALVDIPLDAANYLLHMGSWQELPVIDRVTTVPAFSPDGSLMATPGYHAGLRAYLDLEGFRLPEVPAHPTLEELERARELIIDELLGDFPFVDDASRAHAIALGLQPFVRPLIQGGTPMYLITAPTESSGKTTLARVLAFVASGRWPSLLNDAFNDEAEMGKQLTSILWTGPVTVLLDNINRRMDSGQFAALLTSSRWEGRLLGKNDMVSIPVFASWVATGNNPDMSREISRRTIGIQLDPKSEQPWITGAYRRKNFEGWVQVSRPQLAWAFLVLVRHWFAEGKPSGSGYLASFDTWVAIMGGILGVCGVPGFLENLEKFYQRADSESETWRQFIALWWDRYGERAVTVAELHKMAVEGDCLGATLGDKGPQSQKTRLGQAVRRRLDRIISGFLIGDSGKDSHSKAQVYRLTPHGERDTGPPADENARSLRSLAEPIAEPLNPGPGQIAVPAEPSLSPHVVGSLPFL